MEERMGSLWEKSHHNSEGKKGIELKAYMVLVFVIIFIISHLKFSYAIILSVILGIMTGVWVPREQGAIFLSCALSLLFVAVYNLMGAGMVNYGISLLTWFIEVVVYFIMYIFGTNFGYKKNHRDFYQEMRWD